MNEYDSARMADVLRESGAYEPTEDPAQADLLLLNTCSVREKAQEKVFSDLGRVKHLKAKGAAVKAFTLYVVGEGIEKRKDDFAAEVAAMAKA